MEWRCRCDKIVAARQVDSSARREEKGHRGARSSEKRGPICRVQAYKSRWPYPGGVTLPPLAGVFALVFCLHLQTFRTRTTQHWLDPRRCFDMVPRLRITTIAHNCFALCLASCFAVLDCVLHPTLEVLLRELGLLESAWTICGRFGVKQEKGNERFVEARCFFYGNRARFFGADTETRAALAPRPPQAPRAPLAPRAPPSTDVTAPPLKR